jgi:hypothetical protein
VKYGILTRFLKIVPELVGYLGEFALPLQPVAADWIFCSISDHQRGLQFLLLHYLRTWMLQQSNGFATAQLLQ